MVGVPAALWDVGPAGFLSLRELGRRLSPRAAVESFFLEEGAVTRLHVSARTVTPGLLPGFAGQREWPEDQW